MAWSRLGERLGTPCSRDLFESTFGMHNRQIIPIWLGDDIPELRMDELSREKEAIYREVAAADIRPLAGAVSLITALAKSGFPLAVGSSAPGANVRMVLEALGIADHFAALSTGDDVTHGKPHPEVFLGAASKLGIEPSRCVVVEDAPQGVRAGLAAGCRVVAVTSTRPAAQLDEAHRVVASLEELDADAIRACFEEPSGDEHTPS